MRKFTFLQKASSWWRRDSNSPPTTHGLSTVPFVKALVRWATGKRLTNSPSYLTKPSNTLPPFFFSFFFWFSCLCLSVPQQGREQGRVPHRAGTRKSPHRVGTRKSSPQGRDKEDRPKEQTHQLGSQISNTTYYADSPKRHETVKIGKTKRTPSLVFTADVFQLFAEKTVTTVTGQQQFSTP